MDREFKLLAFFAVLVFVVLWVSIFRVATVVEEQGLESLVESVWCGEDGCDSE